VTVPRSSIAEARRSLDNLEGRLAPLDREILLSEWRTAMGRPGANGSSLQARRRRLLSNPGLLPRLRSYRRRSLPAALDRRIELLERAALEARVEQAPEVAGPRTRLGREIAAFRPRWKARRVGRAVVREALRKDPDRTVRERAYRAEEPLYRPMEASLRDLAAARNDRAREFGFRSFPEFALSFDGLSVRTLEALIDDALRYVPREMRRRRDVFEDRTGERGWYPWDLVYADDLEAGMPDRAFPGRGMLATVVAAVRRWGFPPGAFRFRVDRHDLAFGGLCLAPDPPRDVRVVIHPVGGWEYYLGLFHEVGHALSSASIRQPSHLLRWHEHVPGLTSFQEGIAGFFEQISSSEPWLSGRPGLPAATLRPALEVLRRGPLTAISYLAVWAAQELSLYRAPDGDPAEAGRRLARRIYGFDDYRPISFADTFSVETPLYSTSYILAELVRPALASAAVAEVGGELWPNRGIGPWLVRRWFRDGASYDWRPRLEEVTGRPFGARAFNEEMRAVSG
jgi:Peptidase family M3